jgi:selenocysteine lyase/cysteine desulfurase
VRRIAARTHELASALKDRLAAIPGVRVVTPRSHRLSAGIVAFDVEELPSDTVVSRLRDQGVIGSVAPYPSALVRLTPSIHNNMADIEAAADAMRASV